MTGKPPEKRVKDPTLTVGTEVVEELGSSPQSVTVTRTVYNKDGSVLYDESWRTNYRGEKRVIRVGTKKKEPKPTAHDVDADHDDADHDDADADDPKPPPPPPPKP